MKLPAWLDTLSVEDDGDELPTRSTLNFVGFTVADDPDNERTTVTAAAAPLDSPEIGGVPELSGDGTITTNNAKAVVFDSNPKNRQTTDDAWATLDSFVPDSGSACACSALVTAISDDGTAAAGFALTAVFRNTGGTLEQVGTTTATPLGADDGSWDATLDCSGTTVRLRVKGAAATTVQWGGAWTQLRVIP